MIPRAGAVTGRVAGKALPVAFVAGLAWVLYGAWSTRLFSQSLWLEPGPSLGTALVLAAVVAACLYVTARRGMPLSWGLLALAGFLALVFAGPGAVAALLLLLASGFSLGRRIADDSACEGMHPLVALLAPTALGLALIATAVFALAFTPFNNALSYTSLLLAPLLFGAGPALARVRALARSWRQAGDEGKGWERVAWVLVATACAMRLLAALHPEIGTDALAMHLVIADRLRETGRFHFDVAQSVWAVMPMAADWLLAVPYMLAGEMSSRLANLAAEWMLLGLAWGTARQWLGARAATISALVLATTPLLYLESSTVFIENLWCLWLSASLVFAASTLPRPRWRPVAASAILLGTALAAKVITLFFGGFFLCLAVAWLREDRRPALGWIALAAVLVLLVGAGPYLNAWERTGNPVFPFMNSMFGSNLFAKGNFDNPLYSGGVDWRTVYAMHFDSARFLEGRNGAMGLLFLLALPASLVALPQLPPRLRWAFASALLAICGVFAFQHYLRYILPALPVLALVAGAALAPLLERPRLAWVAGATLLLAGLANLWLAAASTWQYAFLALPPVAGSRAADDFRQGNVPETHAVAVLNAAGARRVLWVARPAIANARADVFVSNWHGWNVAQQLRRIGNEGNLQRWIAGNGIDAVVLGPDSDQPDTTVLRSFLDRHADRIGESGSVAVYAVRPEARFLQELLANPDLDRSAGGWLGEAEWTAAGSVRVSEDRPLVQSVAVQPGREYLLEVEPVCHAGSRPYRLQVNWQDRANRLLGASIQVRQCGGSTQAWVLTAPADAATALVYASGHAPGTPVELSRVSFKR